MNRGAGRSAILVGFAAGGPRRAGVPDDDLRLTALIAINGPNYVVIEPGSTQQGGQIIPRADSLPLDTSDRLSYPSIRHFVWTRGGEMARTSQDVTEAELAVLRRL